MYALPSVEAISSPTKAGINDCESLHSCFNPDHGLWLLNKPQATFLYSSKCIHLLTCVVEGGWLNGAVLEIGICGCDIFKKAFVKVCVLKEDMFKIHLYEPVEKTISLNEASQEKNTYDHNGKHRRTKIKNAMAKVLEHNFKPDYYPISQLLFYYWQ